MARKTIEAEANAAAVSANTSVPGQPAVSLYTGRDVPMMSSTSGGPQYAWSMLASPTCTYSVFGSGLAASR